MNSTKIFGTGIMGLIALFVTLTSCEKTFDNKLAVTSDLNKSNIQVFIATVNASRNVVLLDGKRVSRPVLTSGTSFPTAVYPSTATGSSFSVAGGVHNLSIIDTLAATTQKPLTFSISTDASKYYTVFAYDTITNTKQITVETNIEIPADTTARLRFANFIHDANAVPAVDVFSTRRNEIIFSNINRTDVTGFIPYASLRNDTLVIRQTGTTTVLAQFNSFAPTVRRSYTLVYRGSHRGTKAATVFANY
jgi:hypothetical protein